MAKIFTQLSFLAIKIFLFCIVLLVPHLVSAQTDKEFWFAAPYINDEGRDFDKPITIRITSLALPVTVVISLPADPSFTPITRSIGANSTISIDVTTWISQLQSTPANSVLNKGLLITSTADITAYYEVVSSICNCDPEIFSLKGKNALGTEFFISSQYSYDESTAYNATNSFDIVASKNNTHVTITPTKNIIGHGANIPFTIILNLGQTYSAVATSGLAGGHLQGSYITSDNPIAVTLKDDLVQVSSCADLIGDQTVPTSVLGTEYVVTKGYLQSSDNIYIMAIADGTSVYIDGNTTPVAILAKGASTTLNLSNPSTYIRSTNGIYVYQFTGNGCEAGSAIIPKINCTGSQSVSVVRSSSDLFAVMITTKNGNQGNFTVNGNSTLVKSTDFTAVPGTGGVFVTGRIDLSGTASVGSALNFTNLTGNFSLGFINGGVNDGARYGYFSDFKSSSVQTSSVDLCSSASAQLTAFGGVSYKWSPVAGLSDPNIANPLASPASTTDYTVLITTAEGCVESAKVHVTVTSAVAPTLTINSSFNNICTGTPVTFTATPVNGGVSPVYQWQVNGKDTGTNGNTFTSANLANNDVVNCLLTSSLNCTALVASNNITINVDPLPSVSITASQNNICAGTIISFTATPVNNGTATVYQWQVNGVNAGTNSATFSSSNFANGDNVACVIMGTTPCATSASVTSNVVAMVVNQPLNPFVSIAASANSTCPGGIATFTATPVNGGTAPAYQWLVNGVNAGTNNAVFSSNNLTNGDMISCIITSNNACITMPTATSNAVSVNINLAVSPSVNITASGNNICFGTPIMFTATPVNAGSAPVYQWLVNRKSFGTNSNTFTSITLTDNDIVSCLVTTNGSCSGIVTSNDILIFVSPSPTANAGADKIIEHGNSVKLNATASGSITDITWSPAIGLDDTKTLTPTANPSHTTLYILTVKSVTGCVATSTVKVTVLEDITIPNTFTPNGDGVNDTWQIKNLVSYPDCFVKIFNRWGQEVYGTKGYTNAWDGTRNGKPLPFGTYYYVINLNNALPPMSGVIVLIR